MGWFIDGTALSTLAFNVQNRAAGWKTPPKRGENLVIPGRNGAQWVPNKTFDVGNITLNMWAVGALEDGSLPTDQDSQTQLRDNLDKLTALFAQTSKLLNVVQVSSRSFGITNYNPNPGFDAVQPGTISTYKNSIYAPKMALRATTPLVTNVFPNPAAITEQVPQWQPTYDNIALDPTNKFKRTNAATILTSNYWGASNYEDYVANDTLPSNLWTTAGNTTAIVVTTTGVDQTNNPQGGIRAFRIQASANLAANASLGVKPDFYTAQGYTPFMRFRYRRTQSTSDARTFQVRMLLLDDNGLVTSTGSWQTFTIPSGIVAWADAVYDSSALGVTTSTIAFQPNTRVEFRTGEAWNSSDGMLIDQAMISNKGTDGHTMGYMANIPSPYWFADSGWAGLRYSSAGNPDTVSRWDYVKDQRWTASAATGPTSAWLATVDHPTTDSTGTTLNFIAFGFQTGGTQDFYHECATPTPDVPYALRFSGRGLTGTSTVVSLAKQSLGESSPSVVGSVTVTGSGTAVLIGGRMSGTIGSYVVATSYTPSVGDRIFIKVTTPVITTGQPVFQLTRQDVSSYAFPFTGDSINNTDNQYQWEGEPYNSRSVALYRHVKGIVTPNHGKISTITPAGGTGPTPLVETVAVVPNDPAEILLTPLSLTGHQGVYFAADASAVKIDPAIVGTPVGVASVVFYNAGGDELLTVNGTAQTLNLETTGTVAFTNLFVQVPFNTVPAGATQVSGRVSLQGSVRAMGLRAYHFILTLQASLPSTFGKPNYFDGSTTSAGATWSSTPNDSASMIAVQWPVGWTAPASLPVADAALAAKSIYRTTAPVTTLATGLVTTHPASTYNFGIEVQAVAQDDTGATVAGTVDVQLQFVNSGSVVNTVALGTIRGSLAGWKVLQGRVTSTGVFNEVRIVLTSSVLAFTLLAKINRVFLYLDDATTNAIVPRIAVNKLPDANFVDGTSMWTVAGTVNAITTTDKGPGVKLASTSSVLTAPAFAVTAGQFVNIGTWARLSVIPTLKFYNGATLVSTVTGQSITQPAFTAVKTEKILVPATATSVVISYANVSGGSTGEIAYAYAGIDYTGHDAVGQYDPQFFPYFDGDSFDPYGQPVLWAGTPNNSPSLVTPGVPVGWTYTNTVTAPNLNSTVLPTRRPPGSQGRTGALLRIPASTTRTYRMTGIARGDNNYLSGQIAVATSSGCTLKVMVYVAATDTDTGTLIWQQTVGGGVSTILTWNDLTLTGSYFYVALLHTESVDAPGYRIWIDNLSLVATEDTLEDEYPGYFDGNIGGGGWTGNAGNSVSQYYGGGRRAYAEVRESIDMTSMAGATRAEFSVDMEVPGAFWEDLVTSELTFDFTNAQLIAGTEFDLTALAGGTAPIDDAVVTVTTTGTLNGLTLTDIATGGWFNLNTSAPVPATLVIDNSTFTVKNGSGASVMTQVTRGGSNVLLPVQPVSSTAPPRLKVQVNSGSGQVSIKIQARRRYVIA